MVKITPELLAKSNSEEGHGKALLCWCADNIEKYPELKWLTHIPNGGYRDKITANNLKASGVKSGVPDYLLLVKRNKYACLWIELKRPDLIPKINGKGGVSNEQKNWLNQALKSGHYANVCYGWEHARDLIVFYLEMKD